MPPGSAMDFQGGTVVHLSLFGETIAALALASAVALLGYLVSRRIRRR
jgi:hypothetical protein